MDDAKPEPTYSLTRFAFLRLLGLVYVVAFAVVINHWAPLLGSHGLLPAREVLDDVVAGHGHGPLTFLRLPTLFLFDDSDPAFRIGGWIGLGLSLCVLLGFANVFVLAALWILYMSYI